jgi:hypothetical protein
MTTGLAAPVASVLEMGLDSETQSQRASPNDDELEAILTRTTLAEVVEHDVDGEDIIASTADPTRPSDGATAASVPSDAYYEILSKALEHTTACTTCPSAFAVMDETDSEDVSQVVKPLLRDVGKDGKARAVALQKLYRMTDRERQRNRCVRLYWFVRVPRSFVDNVPRHPIYFHLILLHWFSCDRLPMICTTKFNIIRELLPCLSSEAASTDRRRALLLIANLAIPTENKAVMLLSGTIDDLLPALLRIVRGRWNESYLAAACLFNLSYLGDAKGKLLRYVAPQLAREDEDNSPALSYEFHLPEDNPCSLLRILESLLVEYTGFVSAPSVAVQASVQREAVRWSMATLCNLVTNAPDNAIVVGTKTGIPALAVTCLDLTDRDLELWSPDSLENSCLMLLARVAVRPESWASLSRLLPDLDRVFGKLRGKGGIHEVRAAAILSHLKEEADERSVNKTSGDSPRVGEPPIVMVTSTAI